MSRGALGVRSFQTMMPMSDGARLNTFVFLPEGGGPRFPVILHRTPYGIAAANARDKFDYTNAWLPSAAEPMRGSILRGWRNIVARGYVAVSPREGWLRSPVFGRGFLLDRQRNRQDRWTYTLRVSPD